MAVSQRYLHLVLIGLVQGLVLYGLYRGYEHNLVPPEAATAFNALLMPALFLPLVVFWTQDLLTGKLRGLFCLLIAVIAAAFGIYHATTAFPVLSGNRIVLVGFPVMFAFAVAAFISVPLMSGRAQDAVTLPVLRYWDYARLFDDAWRNAVLSLQALVLTCLFWGILEIGAQLFALIGVEWIRDELLHKSWFAIPLTTTSFAFGFRAGLRRADFTRALRNHWLTITAWLLVVVSVIGSGFILTALGGVGTLFERGVSAVFLLWFVAFWVKFYNCAFQTGASVSTIFGRALRAFLGFATVPMLVMAGFAAYAMYLRIAQHGLTPDRIWGLLVVAAALIYGGGYALGLRPRLGAPWLKTLPATNVLAALAILLSILLLLSPVLDPRRLAVDDQLARLAAGKIAPEAFDAQMFVDAGRYGYDVLQRHAAERDAQGEVTALAGRAQEALQAARNQSVYSEAERQVSLADDFAARLEVFPHGTEVPAGLIEAITREVDSWEKWQQDKSCFAEHALIRCPLLRVDLNGDGAEEAVLWEDRDLNSGRVYQMRQGKWLAVGEIRGESYADRAEVWSALRKGDISARPSAWQDLHIGKQRLDVNEWETSESQSDEACTETAK
ncbi:MAG: DUF4153 domain-containing protein [Gammaproteobacteria bacterium]|nr:DUF4153 domain-containing protein [Gammaproteobacteria bacterium]